MALTVLSWNMQGCMDNSKIKALNTLIDHIVDEGNQCVVLLQECGDQKSNGFYPQKPVAWNEKLNCICYNHEHLSFEHRSSMAILASCNMGGIVGNHDIIAPNRPMPFIMWGDRIIATFHAPDVESEAVMYTKIALDNLRKTKMDWLLVGDFNADPNCFNSDKTIIRPDCANKIQYGDGASLKCCSMIYPTGNTYGEYGIRTRLTNYAFMSNLGYFNDHADTQMINIALRDDAGNLIGTHNLIGLRFNS